MNTYGIKENKCLSEIAGYICVNDFDLTVTSTQCYGTYVLPDGLGIDDVDIIGVFMGAKSSDTGEVMYWYSGLWLELSSMPIYGGLRKSGIHESPYIIINCPHGNINPTTGRVIWRRR